MKLRWFGLVLFLGFGSQELLTSGLKSTAMDVAYLDDAPEPIFTPLAGLAREADGSFALDPGAYEMEFESYCLLPGTHGPIAGDGYLLAPLAGDAAGVIEAVLDRSLQHPDIPQQDIQQLLWAVLSRAELSSLDAEVRHAAASLLTPEEIKQVARFSGTSMADRVRGELFARAPAPVQAMLEAHDRLRALLSDASATYEQMREVAVLDGPPAPQPGDREIPAARWSYHPDGYFIRFASDHFSRTRVQLIVPRSVRASLTRDSLGRVTQARYPGGLIVDAEYDDAIPALEVPGDPGLKGYAFRSLRFSNGTERAEIANTGWTFAGRSNGRGDASRLPSEAVADAGAGDTLEDSDEPRRGPFTPDFQWKQRYERARERYQKWQDLQKDTEARRAADERSRRGPSERDAADVTDEGHYRDGYDAATSGDLEAKLDWIKDQKRRERNAAEYIHCMLTGTCDERDDEKKTPPRKRRVKPSRGAAVPGAQGGQRLGMGARGAS